MKKRTKLQLTALACTVGLFSATNVFVQADDCLFMKSTQLVSGEMGSWKIGGFDPGDDFTVVWGLRLGKTVVDDYQGYCATFGIAGVSTKRILGQGQADSYGTGYIDRMIPKGTAGITVYTQVAKRFTCPDECTSNIVESVIQ